MVSNDNIIAELDQLIATVTRKLSTLIHYILMEN